MSSRFSPSIEVDCRLSRSARRAIATAYGAAVIIPLFAGLEPDALLACLIVALALTVAAGHAVLQGTALHRAVLTPEGKWWLVDAEGRTLPGRLLPGSRVFTHGIWLCWHSSEGRRHAILWRRSTQGDAVRRLAGRLKLDGLPVYPCPDPAQS